MAKQFLQVLALHGTPVLQSDPGSPRHSPKVP